jgi:hypothetical protein
MSVQWKYKQVIQEMEECQGYLLYCSNMHMSPWLNRWLLQPELFKENLSKLNFVNVYNIGWSMGKQTS